MTLDVRGGVTCWGLEGEGEGVGSKMTGHSLEVRCCCCCSTGKFAATAGVDGRVIVWDVVKCCLAWQTMCEGSPTVVSLTDDGRILWWGDRCVYSAAPVAANITQRDS